MEESKALNSYPEAIKKKSSWGRQRGLVLVYLWDFLHVMGTEAGVFIRSGQTGGGKTFTAIFYAIVGGL
jgi:hypothetical protein